MAYDKLNRRLYFRNSTEKIFSASLDGSDVRAVLNSPIIKETFTVDGSDNVIYYVHQFRDIIFSFNMTGFQDDPIQSLDTVRGIKDAVFDVKNG